jgi:hypothetical protein
MEDYKKKRKDLRDRKREAMNEEYKSAKERKGVVNTFKRESRSIKRSEKNEIKKDLRNNFGI